MKRIIREKKKRFLMIVTIDTGISYASETRKAIYLSNQNVKK